MQQYSTTRQRQHQHFGTVRVFTQLLGKLAAGVAAITK